MSKNVIALHCLLALAAALPPAQAQTSDKPDNYTHALALTVSGKESVVQLRLPKEVYLHALTADLRDLRVFDAQDNKLPFSVQQPAARAERSRRDLPVRLFGVRAARGAAGHIDTELDVRRSPDGTLLSVSARTLPAVAGDAIDTLVLDLGAAARTASIDALRFALPPGTASYSARVALEVSDDLKQWDTVGDSEIAWLVNERTETLASDRIDFEPRSFRYARLSWREGKPLQFASITAESPLSTAVAPYVERLLIPPAPGRFPNDFVYPSSVAIPVQRIGLDLGVQNVVLPAQLGRYIELPAPRGGELTIWRFEQIAAATFYQLNQGGKRRISGDVAITPAHNAQWVLRTETSGIAAPALRLAWSPASVVFLANGKPPYRLVFGRADAEPGSRALAQVAPGFTPAEILALESATPGPLQVLQAAPAADLSAAAAAADSARIRMFALWAALLAGVGVLAFMAWRLLKQMK